MRVIAVGSPFTGDDLAWRVSDQLQAQFPEIEFIKLDRPGSQLIEYIKNSDVPVVMDALQTPVAESVLELGMADLLQEASFVSSHGFGVTEALQLAQAMQVLPERLRIFGLSPYVEIQTLTDDIIELLQADITNCCKAKNVDVV